MNEHLNIQEELKGLAPGLVGISRQMPHNLPEGFFDSFPVKMLAQVAGPLPGQGVPEGYFESFADKMLQKIKSLEQAEAADNTAQSLASISRQMPYTVPQGYFETLPDRLLQQAKATTRHELEETAPMLAAMGKHNAYSVPEGYFNSLADTVLRRVKEPVHELAETAPLLVGISRQMPYDVPPLYFEQLQPPVPAETVRLIPFYKKTVMKWAVAASVAVLTGLFGWQFLWKANNGNTLMANAETDSAAALELTSALAQLPTDSLTTDLDEGEMSAELGATLYYLNTENFESALKDFSADELATHLDEQGKSQKNEQSNQGI